MPNKKMSPGEIKARIGSSIVARRAAVKKAKENKPSKRINLDDLSRAVKAMKKASPGKIKAVTGLKSTDIYNKTSKDMSPSVTFDKDGNITIKLFSPKKKK